MAAGTATVRAMRTHHLDLTGCCPPPAPLGGCVVPPRFPAERGSPCVVRGVRRARCRARCWARGGLATRSSPSCGPQWQWHHLNAAADWNGHEATQVRRVRLTYFGLRRLLYSDSRSPVPTTLENSGPMAFLVATAAIPPTARSGSSSRGLMTAMTRILFGPFGQGNGLAGPIVSLPACQAAPI